MKPAVLASVIHAYATGLRSGGANASDLGILADAIEGWRGTSVANAVDRISAGFASIGSSGSRLGPLASLVAPLASVLAPISKTAPAEIDALVRFLQAHPAASLSDLQKPMAAARSGRATGPKAKARSAQLVRPEVVSQYVEALRNSRSDERTFPVVHAQLSEDSGLSAREVIEIARGFTGASAASKASALKKIWGAHQELMVTRAKRLATAGRTAA